MTQLHSPAPTHPTAPAAEPRAPSYRDAELHRLMKALRASVKPNPEARQLLKDAETRLRYILRVIEQSDAAHADKAELLLSLGNLPAANVEASLIFDADTRRALYERTQIGADEGDTDRLVAAAELGREVLQ